MSRPRECERGVNGNPRDLDRGVDGDLSSTMGAMVSVVSVVSLVSLVSLGHGERMSFISFGEGGLKFSEVMGWG